MPDMPDSAKIVRLEEKVKYLEERSNAQQQEILQLKGDIAIYQAATGQMNNKLNQIYNAIIGDEMGNVGLVKRVANIEVVVAWVNAKKTAVVAIVTGLGVAASAGYWLFERIIEWIK